jgi:FkbM family methyltransferase
MIKSLVQIFCRRFESATDGDSSSRPGRCASRAEALAADADPTPDRPHFDAGDARRETVVNIDGLSVFVDRQNYHETIVHYLDLGEYEGRERFLAEQLIRPDDRVLEVGTAIGVVSMTIARIVGAQNIRTFDANPDIVADARANFRRNGLHRIDSRVGVLRTRRDIERCPGETDFFVDKAFWASRLDASLETQGIVKVIKIPTFPLEDQIASHSANVIVCDIEGGEAALFGNADLAGVRLIVMETHDWAVGADAIGAMTRKLELDGFVVDPQWSLGPFLVLSREPQAARRRPPSQALNVGV